MPSVSGDIIRVTPQIIAPTAVTIQNVWNVRISQATGDDNAIRTACAEYMDAIYLLVQDYISDEGDFDVINVYIYRDKQSLGDVAWPTLVNGDALGDMYATGVASLGSAASGISRRVARKYFGPLSEANILDGDIIAGGVTAVNAAMNKGFTSFTASNGLTLIGVVYDAVLGVARTAISVSASGIPGYQRRRREGVGI